MKEITKYWKQTCIDFGRFVQSQTLATAMNMGTSDLSIESLWERYQKQMAKDVMDVLDDVDSNDQINCYCGHTTMCDCQPLNAIEKAENDFIKSKIEEGEESGFVDKTRQK